MSFASQDTGSQEPSGLCGPAVPARFSLSALLLGLKNRCLFMLDTLSAPKAVPF